ncbi:hypothetical protein M409DRAFT_27102 [Zasmidium cellare ATCC 36951]|uniref:Uncharacterized protein n=1 Tax=Zasmidium cellare ATCC 36951 TaxID=1080233 RepID=A0A6A6C5M6_ZASCE|nr:uncharacterized protein M409DRAFT_27102 [Zasmidium cellare ATCC 36951]KAF2162477.1 hypothetical protein M409DRAFT_27102 [Zasmidium cellare ATCC 36951]
MPSAQFSWKPIGKWPWQDNTAAYTALNNGTPDAIGRSDELDQADVNATKRSSTAWTIGVLFCIVLLTNTFTFTVAPGIAKRVGWLHANIIDTDQPPKSWALVDGLPTKFTRFNWWTEYSDKNFTETDALWDDINPAHGFIAVDREWATAQHWPKSMHLPSDSTKNVYLLEAYHLMHCITVIRKTFWQAVHHQDYTFNPPHAGHCIDMMRQYIICKADNTPLYTFGDDSAGDEQVRKCQSWDALRDFATENSACYRDTPPDVDSNTFPLGAHFGYCDSGYDGVKEGERRGSREHGAVWDEDRR